MNESEVESQIHTVLQIHNREINSSWREMEEFRAVADNEMWGRTGPFGSKGWYRPNAAATLKVKFTVNRVRPWMERRKADLYRVAPTVKVQQPVVGQATGRRGWTPKVGAALGDLASAWLTSPDVREAIEMLQDLALVTKASALKIGVDPKRRGLGAVWAQAIPRWDIVWDDAVDSVRRARWWGHLRWERVDEARRLCPELPEENKGVSFGDFLADGNVMRTDQTRRPIGYVRMIEWWDMVTEQVQVFVVEGEHGVCAYGSKPEKMLAHPDGRPCVQLIPCILAPSLAKPLRGVALAKPQLDESVEKSYLSSYVMTAVRRELARVALYRKSQGFSDPEAKRIADGDDLEMFGIDDASGIPLDKLIHVVQFPETSNGVERVMRLATELADQSTSQSALGRGSTSGVEYASATAAQALAAGDAAVASLAAARMQSVMVRAVEVMFALLGSGSSSLKVQTASGVVQLKPPHFRAEVEVKIDDQAAQAAQSSARKAELLQALPLMRDLAALASTTAANGAESPDALRRGAEVMYDTVVETFQLPNDARWAAVVKAEPLVEEEDEDKMELEEPAPVAAPPMPPAAPPGPQPDQEAAAKLAAEMTPEELRELEQALMQMEVSDADGMA